MRVDTEHGTFSDHRSTRRISEDVLVVRTTDEVDLSMWRARDPGVVRDASPAVILCHGFVQNRQAFHCRTRSLVTHLCRLGYTVYTPELRGRHGQETADGLADYVERDAPAIIARVTAEHRAVAWVGHSMGGLVGALLRQEVMDRLVAVAALGSPLFPGRSTFHLPRPLSAAIRVARRIHRRGTAFDGRAWGRALWRGRAVFDDPSIPNPLRVWAPRSLDDETLTFTLDQAFAGDSWGAFADMLELVVSDAERAGEIDVTARLSEHTCPLFVVAANADDLAPPSSVMPLYQRSGASVKEFVLVGGASDVHVGHIDLLVGQAAPRLVWAPLTRFLQTHLAVVRSHAH